MMMSRITDICWVTLGALALWLLAGCASAPQVRTVEVSRPVLPPAVLCMETPVPARAYTTNRELLDWALDLQAALTECNSDKAQLRAWRQRVEGESNAATPAVR